MHNNERKKKQTNERTKQKQLNETKPMIMLGGVEKPALLQNFTPCFNISKR